MDERPLYHRDPCAREVSTRVLRAGLDGDRPFVVLEDDLFYPEGGGQPPDGGTVAGVEVADVQKRGDEVRVVLARAVGEGPVEARLDWERRFDNMQQHTGQHLLTAVAEDAFGWATTAFHLGAAYSAIELDTRSVPEREMARLEERVNAAVREARDVRPRLVSPEEYAGLAVRSRGLPDGHRGPVRLVEIEGIDRNTCGGTHCASTAELQAVRLLGTEPMRGGTRLHFLVGGRVLRDARRAAGIEEALKERLGCGADDFARVLDRRAQEARALRRRAESAEGDLAGALGAALAAGASPRVVHVARGRDAGFLHALGAAYLGARPDGAAVLLAEDGASAYLLVVAGEGSAVDAGSAGAAVVAALGGRGGGRGPRFQGKGPDPGRLEAAERAAREALGLE